MSDIFIDDTGKGYPLVLVHGYLGSSEMWCWWILWWNLLWSNENRCLYGKSHDRV